MTLTMSATLVIVMATVMPNHFTRAWIVMKNVIFARKVTAHAKMVLLVSPMTSHLILSVYVYRDTLAKNVNTT